MLTGPREVQAEYQNKTKTRAETNLTQPHTGHFFGLSTTCNLSTGSNCRFTPTTGAEIFVVSLSEVSAGLPVSLPSHIPLFPCAVRMRGQISRRKSVENFMHSLDINWTHWLVIRLHFNCQSNRTTTRGAQSDKATERASEQGPNFTRTNISFNEMKCREGIFNDRTANCELGPQLR